MLERILNRFKSDMRFDDGDRLALLHRYAIRYCRDDKYVDIGFEQAIEPDIDRLIHESSISEWAKSGNIIGKVSDKERDEILDRIMKYCHDKHLTYRVVR